MEFITFELEGKRHGWYKSYRRLNETDMEIIIQSIEGKTLRSGFLRKSKNPVPKGKAVSMREMKLDAEIGMIYEYLRGIMLENVTVTAPRLPQGGGYVWGNQDLALKITMDTMKVVDQEVVEKGTKLIRILMTTITQNLNRN